MALCHGKAGLSNFLPQTRENKIGKQLGELERAAEPILEKEVMEKA